MSWLSYNDKGQESIAVLFVTPMLQAGAQQDHLKSPACIGRSNPAEQNQLLGMLTLRT